MKTVPNKTKRHPLTITLTRKMTDDFTEIASKLGWSQAKVIERCLAASIKAVRQFEARHDGGEDQ